MNRPPASSVRTGDKRFIWTIFAFLSGDLDSAKSSYRRRGRPHDHLRYWSAETWRRWTFGRDVAGGGTCSRDIAGLHTAYGRLHEVVHERDRTPGRVRAHVANGILLSRR